MRPASSKYEPTTVGAEQWEQLALFFAMFLCDVQLT
jgi:hypothetical protein